MTPPKPSVAQPVTNDRQLGRCDKRQYEHFGEHQRVGEYGQSMPPFPCVNWKPVSAETAAPTEQEGEEDDTTTDTVSRNAGLSGNSVLESDSQTASVGASPTGAALEPGSAEALWKQMFPLEVDEAGVCEFAEAYASKLRAEVERLKLVLKEIDGMLDGGLPITHQVKSIVRAALKASEDTK